MYQQDDLLPINRNYSILIGCFTLIFTIIIVTLTINTIRNQKQETVEVSNTVSESPKRMADLTKYNQDSDRDLIPNFIEEEAILNTYISEISYCQQSNPVCSSNPYDKEIYLSIMLDSSTSTDIPASGQETKLDIIKSRVENLLREADRRKYIKTQIVGYGNKGSTSFIADNESCVSNLRFKDFNQEPKNEEVIPQILKNYVSNGKSPTGYTLEQVEKTFPKKDGNNIVVIVTDGADDCGADLKTVFNGILSRGVVKKIHVISIISPQDERDKLKDATETNGGQFTENFEINQFSLKWVDDYLFETWCRQGDLNKIYQCLDRNYGSAIKVLEKQLTAESAQNEVSKVGEIKSSINLLIQNYINSEKIFSNQVFKEAFNNINK